MTSLLEMRAFFNCSASISFCATRPPTMTVGSTAALMAPATEAFAAAAYLGEDFRNS